MLHYLFHVFYPLLLKAPLIGPVVPYFSFLLAFTVSIALPSLLGLRNIFWEEPCIPIIVLLVLNVGLVKAMWGHVRNVLEKGGITARKRE